MASKGHQYGRAIEFDFFPRAGDEEIAGLELVSARLYGPNVEPTSDQLANTQVGHVDEQTEWDLLNEEGTGPAGYRITFDAQEDDNPESSEEQDRFVVVVNYLAETGGPELRVSKQIFVNRPDGLTSKVRVTADDVFALESKIQKLKPILWVERKIDLAIDDLLNRLEGRGYATRYLFNLEKLNLAATMLACSYCCEDLAGEGNQFWMTKADRWSKRAELNLDIAKVGFDSQKQGRPEPTDTVQTGGAVAILR